MIVLKTSLDFRPEHMQMYFGTKEEFEIKLKEDSPLVLEVLDLLNDKLNEDLSTELLLMESTEIDRNLYSFLRTLRSFLILANLKNQFQFLCMLGYNIIFVFLVFLFLLFFDNHPT